MAEFALSDEAIAVMVDIARTAGRDLDPAHHLERDRLVAAGLVAKAPDDREDSSYKVTARGQHVLDQRGVGANEA
jgi:hypothetical protein